MSAPPSEVVDRLDRLVTHAPTASLDPDALWASGRRRQRRRWVVVAACVAVLAGLGAAGVAPLVRLADPPVATVPERAGMVLPDVVRQPGRWEPAFRDVPERLSAVGVAPRSSLWSSSNAVWGVSAATGESRFLDLPGAADLLADPVLSADGRLLAYWTTGEVAGEPMGGGSRGSDVVPVVGVTVLDLRTGKLEATTVESTHGLSTGGLAWAGDVLWWSAGPVRPAGPTSTVAKLETRAWDVRTGDSLELTTAQRRQVYPGGSGDAPDGFVQVREGRSLLQVTRDETTRLGVVLPAGAPAEAGVTQPAVSTDGARLAALLLPDMTREDDAPATLLVGAVDGRSVALEPIGGPEDQALAGWRSPTEVVVTALGYVEDGRPQRALRASVVDVTTGERTDLVEFEGATPRVAADAWEGDVVAAPSAPFAPDPRLVGAGSVVVLAFGISLWRDLRRRRGHP